MRRHDHTFILAVVIGIVGAAAPWGCSDPEVSPKERTTKRETPVVHRKSPASPAPATVSSHTATPAPEGRLTPAQLEPRIVSFAAAETAYRDKHYAEAVELFTAYVAQKPQNPWGQYMLGLSAWKAGENEKAERAFEAAHQLDPRHLKSLLNWSRVLLDTGRNDVAITKIEAALAIDAASNDAYRLLGRARAAMGQVDAAVAAYQQALALDENDVWSMNNLGLIWIRAGRYAEALPPLARAVVLRNDVAIFHNNLGVALERTGHPAAAAAAYRQAVALDAKYDKASLSLARLEASGQGTTASIDLAAVAQEFEAEVRGWRQSMPGQASAPVGAAEAIATEKAQVAQTPRSVPPDDND